MTTTSTRDAAEFGGELLRHFLIFVTTVFLALFAFVLTKKNPNGPEDAAIVKIYAPSSFISQWGPGPWLREQFEKTCQCKVEFYDSGELSLLLQKLKQQDADLVLGLDQYDIETAISQLQWKKVENLKPDWDKAVANFAERHYFLAYDWGVLSMIVRQSENGQLPRKIDDFLDPAFKGKISLQDPRTSAVGLQFVLWLIQVKGEEAAFSFLRKFDSQVMGYSPSWSTSYGLFQKGQAKATFSYITSPVYHLVEEKNMDVVALQLEEPLPYQIEYMGVPASCKNCDLSMRFVEFLLSPAGQKIIMEKNYMFPARQGVRDGTPFSNIPSFDRVSNLALPSAAERERLINRWLQIRK